MPVYHGGKRPDEIDHLVEAIESLILARQSPAMPPHELIIVNDASKNPETRAAILALKQKYDPDDTWIKLVLNDQNGGPSYARNCGLAIAKYDLITGLDADNILKAEAVSFYKDAIESMLQPESKIAISVSRLECFGFSSSQFVVPDKLTPRIVVEYGYVDTSSIFRRDELNKIGGWRNDSPKAEDYKLAISVLANRWREGLENDLVYSVGDVIKYRQYDDSLNVAARVISDEALYAFLFSGDEDFIERTIGYKDSTRFIHDRRTKDIFFDIAVSLQRDFFGTVQAHLSRSSKLNGLFNAVGLNNPFARKPTPSASHQTPELN